MAIYRGIVRNNKVELDDPVHLPEGLHVHIHTQAAGHDEALEDPVEEKPRERGLLGAPRSHQLPSRRSRHAPITIMGAPLSETIIAGRR